MTLVTIKLPWPPSVNAMWRTPRTGKLAGRTLLSAEGRSFRKDVADNVMLQRVPRHTLTGKLSVLIYASPPDRRARDLDNLLKAPLDALQHAGVIHSDADIDDLRIVRLPPSTPAGEIEIVIEEISAALMRQVAA